MKSRMTPIEDFSSFEQVYHLILTILYNKEPSIPFLLPVNDVLRVTLGEVNFKGKPFLQMQRPLRHNDASLEDAQYNDTYIKY